METKVCSCPKFTLQATNWKAFFLLPFCPNFKTIQLSLSTLMQKFSMHSEGLAVLLTSVILFEGQITLNLPDKLR